MDFVPHWKRSEMGAGEFIDPLRCNLWNLIIPAVASLVGGYLSGKGGEAAANAQEDAANKTVGLQRDIYADQRNLAKPGYLTGGAATNLLGLQYGIGPQNYEAAFGAGASGADDQWTAYLNSDPALQAEWQRLTTQSKNPFKTPQEYAQWHWSTFGQKEGRTLPQVNNTTNGLTSPTGSAPSGGAGTNGLTDPMAGFMSSPYGQIATSGFRGVDVPQINSAFARGGKVLSGAQSIALDERGKARLGGAYTDYTNGLRSLAGLGQTASSQISGAAGQYGANAGNAIMAGGEARANGLTSAYGGLANGVNGALSTVMDYGKKNWGWT